MRSGTGAAHAGRPAALTGPAGRPGARPRAALPHPAGPQGRMPCSAGPSSLTCPPVPSEADGMKLDSAGLQVLSPAECVELLATTPIGRVVFTDHALPAVQPVNFVLDGMTVVMRTTAGSKLAVAARNTVVAFETDEFDPVTRTG